MDRHDWRPLVALYLLLLVICLPFDHLFLPDLGRGICDALWPMLRAIGERLSTDPLYDWRVASDSPGMMLLAVILVPLTIGLHQVIRCLSPVLVLQIMRGVESLLLLYLAMQLGRYGVSKMLGRQFMAPEANLLFTPLGQFDKDMLLWSTMGSSYGYQAFLGVSELLAAILLLHRRWRVVGLILSSSILIQVAAIDLAYGIDVRAYALILLSISLYLGRRWWVDHVVMENGRVHMQLGSNRKRSSMTNILRPMAVGAIALEWLYPLIVFGPQLHSSPIPFPSSTVYEICSETGPRRIFFHSQGYLITQDEAGRFTDHPIALDPIERTIHFIAVGEGSTLAFDVDQDGNDHLIGEVGGQCVDWAMRAIALDSLPLRK